ncbi:MAG: arginine repressor [Clostridiales bacterium 43-6]|nr:MAG: arginine repressor [Clostridiales bacterium 43-6]
MKRRRLAKILELIEIYTITTQEEMLQWLKASGFDVTQATVSRDIKELRLIKALDSSGNYKYVSVTTGTTQVSPKFVDIFSNAVIHIDYAMNDIVIKCYSGMANAACAAFDSMNYPNVVGTLAGDDTFFVIMRSEKDASALVEKLNEIIVR